METPLEGRFQAGEGGVRLIWPDGGVTEYPEHSVIHFERRPARIVGRLYALDRDGRRRIEAPELRA